MKCETRNGVVSPYSAKTDGAVAKMASILPGLARGQSVDRSGRVSITYDRLSVEDGMEWMTPFEKRWAKRSAIFIAACALFLAVVTSLLLWNAPPSEPPIF